MTLNVKFIFKNNDTIVVTCRLFLLNIFITYLFLILSPYLILLNDLFIILLKWKIDTPNILRVMIQPQILTQTYLVQTNVTLIN